MITTVGDGVHVGAGVKVGGMVGMGGGGNGVTVGKGVRVGSGVFVGVAVSSGGTETTIDVVALPDVLKPKVAFVDVTTLWLEKVPACL